MESGLCRYHCAHLPIKPESNVITRHSQAVDIVSQIMESDIGQTRCGRCRMQGGEPALYVPARDVGDGTPLEERHDLVAQIRPIGDYRPGLPGAFMSVEDFLGDRLEGGSRITGRRNFCSGVHHRQLRSRSLAGVASVSASAEPKIRMTGPPGDRGAPVHPKPCPNRTSGASVPRRAACYASAPDLINDSAGMPSSRCRRQIILRLSDRSRFSTSYTRFRPPMQGARSLGASPFCSM